ncbi:MULTISPECIES: hypothetical protein [Aequorivita]|uniref:Uncharacterized protein n=1 Tax=Aequorivita iocasae TaxID=2803865 RepID=A0ABX7DQC1_9FLAO|nr:MULTISPECIES: hypothetical protein [Aequorivita]QQX76320.1 hypothetical protein JK629_13465 [Aequorivita iocasae]UCA55784.1 hypothetical protein LDL78_13530 [Aequorivita sp. F7]
MKKILIVFALAAFTSGFAQVDRNTNTKETTIVKKTYIEDDKGIDVETQKATISQQRQLALKNTDVVKTNYSVTMTPITINTDYSYTFNNNKYSFSADNNGYILNQIVTGAQNSEYAKLKPLGQKGYYLFKKDGQTSVGYFNQYGNFVVEGFDSNTDNVSTTIFKLDDKSKSMMKEQKM